MRGPLSRLVFSLGRVVWATMTCFRLSPTIPFLDTPTGLVCDCRSCQTPPTPPTPGPCSGKNSHSSDNDTFIIIFLCQSSIVGHTLTFSLLVTVRYGLTTFPAADPLLAVGTYTASTGALSSGYTIVFDKANQGKAYLTSGSTTAFQGSTESVMTLAPYVTVNMNNIVLSADALGITMAGTAYILDKVHTWCI